MIQTHRVDIDEAVGACKSDCLTLFVFAFGFLLFAFHIVLFFWSCYLLLDKNMGYKKLEPKHFTFSGSLTRHKFPDQDVPPPTI